MRTLMDWTDWPLYATTLLLFVTGSGKVTAQQSDENVAPPLAPPAAP